MLSGSILIERQLRIMEIYSGDGNVKIHLELADNSVFVFKLFLRLLSSVEIKSLQPLWESLKLRLAFQFIGVDLQNIVKKAKSFLLTFSRATLDLTLFLCTFGLNFVPHTLPEPVAIDFNATSQRIYDRVSDVVENGVSFASKILTHNRMHWHWSKIANLKANMPRIQNMYNMYRAKVDRLAGKNYFLQKMA